MNCMKKILLLSTFLLMAIVSFAQRTIKGNVTSNSDKQPVIGANVIAKGTKAVATTDLDGNFTLNVPKEATQIEISYVGMETQTIPLGTSNVIDVSMKDAKALEELVVIGYGTQKRKDLTGAITSITSENFVKGPIQTPEQLVAGKVAGVQITSNGGRPGAGSTIRIRGGSSLNANNEPLIVIDGVPVESAQKADGSSSINGAANPLSFINPADIESITVLKDASATAIFGSRASNGVIMVVTKKGASGKPKISFSTIASVGQPTGYVDVFTGDEFRKMVDTLKSVNDAQKKLLGKANTDWQKEIFRNAISFDNNLSVSGTTAGVPYRVGVNYLNQNGIVRTSNMQRMGASIGLTPTFLDKSLKIDVNYKLSYLTNAFADQGAIGSATTFDPTQPVRTDSTKYGGYFEWLTDTGEPNKLAPRNPLALLNLKKDGSKLLRHIGNVQVEYKLPFVKGLKAVVNTGADIVGSKGDKETPKTAAAGYYSDGYTGEYWQNKVNSLFDSYLNYNNKVGIGQLDVTSGYSYQSFYNESRGYDKDANRTDFVRNQDTSKNVLLSFFGRANYNIADKYLLTATLRADASSRFAPSSRWGYFPSFAFAWKLGEEGFIKNMGVFSDLKLRLGYGQTGQQDIGLNYQYLPKYTPAEAGASYQFGNALIPTLRPQEYDEQLRWETTTTYNVALDYGFWGGRLFGSVDFYQRDTKDLLSETPVPAGSNLKNRIFTNVGALSNRGVELIVNVNPIKTSKLDWTVGVNLTRNINEITSLSKIQSAKSIGIATGGIAGGVGNNVQLHTVGYPRSSFYVYQQVYDTNGKPIENLFADYNKDGKFDADDKYVAYSPDPKVFLGFNSQVTSGNVSLGFTARANIGNYVYNNVYSNLGLYNKIAPQGTYLNNISTSVIENNLEKETPEQQLSDLFLENASFFRMDNIFVNYNVPMKSKLRLGLNFNVQNAFVISKYKGIDPEIFNGIDNDFYPRARVYAVGVNLNF
jgi:TonB-dependent starch-binding outer membrane protein SusC